jgi:ferric-dicitrate binding protein FerR (iron transport regulator)
MLNKEDIEKLDRYIQGLSDKVEIDYVESLISKGEGNDLLKQWLEKDWNKFIREASTPEENLNPILDRIHHIIRKEEASKRKRPMHQIVQIYMKVAAVMLLPLLLAVSFIYLDNYKKQSAGPNNLTTIYAPLGSRVKFNLPDGSTGMLNSGSDISYSLPFIDHRSVSVEGEAWLEVKHDDKHPMEISAGSSVIKVLGTSLNVSAYPEEKYVEVVLHTGKVEFQMESGGEKIVMLPSEKLVFQNGKISKSITDPTKYNAWTQGKLVFRNDPMSEVARRIERWYNIEIVLADKELEKYSFRATFQDDNLGDVLGFLRMTSPIKYQITPSTLLKDGTYQKEKVTIYLKK